MTRIDTARPASRAAERTSAGLSVSKRYYLTDEKVVLTVIFSPPTEMATTNDVVKDEADDSDQIRMVRLKLILQRIKLDSRPWDEVKCCGRGN